MISDIYTFLANLNTTQRSELESRFWSKVNRRGSDECWLWLAGCFANGYGEFSYRNKPYGAHQIAFAFSFASTCDVGKPCILHRCDIHNCCNPAHLFAGSQADNMADKVAKGRQARGETHGFHLHPEACARGDRNGSRLHPESRPRGAAHSRTMLRVAACGERNAAAKLNASQATEMRVAFSRGGVSQAELARCYLVDRATVRRVLRRDTWKNTP